MPDSTTEPDQTIADLDQWCQQHLDEHGGTRYNAGQDGIEYRMVSANLPEHTPNTEMASLTRTATYLTKCSTNATGSRPSSGGEVAPQIAVARYHGHSYRVEGALADGVHSVRSRTRISRS